MFSEHSNSDFPLFWGKKKELVLLKRLHFGCLTPIDVASSNAIFSHPTIDASYLCLTKMPASPNNWWVASYKTKTAYDLVSIESTQGRRVLNMLLP